jgi:trehalose/maltose transport system substrate-binding protein
MPIPRGGARGVNASALGGWNLAVAAHSKQPALAADLIRYLLSPEQQKAAAHVAGGSGGPTLTALYHDPEILRLAPFQKLLLPVLAHVAARPSRITRTHYAEFSAAVYNTIHAVLAGKVKEAEGMSDLQNRLNELSRSWKRVP